MNSAQHSSQSAEQPIPLLFEGKAGSYFGTDYEALPAELPEAVINAGRSLATQGLIYCGKLAGSHFAGIAAYTYRSDDQRTVVSIMADQIGLQGIDCVSRFTDGSFLTTTTTKVLAGAYDEQGLFHISYPGFESGELLAQHQVHLAEYEKRCGGSEAGFGELLAIAQMVDEYTIRQESNSGHGFLQFAGGFAQAGLAHMMSDGDYWEEQDYDEDEDNEDADDENIIEYDEDAVSPLTQAILRDDSTAIEQLLAAGTELNPQGWDVDVPLVAAVHRGNPVVIEQLVAAGAELDRLDMSVDARPLGVAIKQQNIELIQLLLKLGASPEGGDLSYTGLTIAVEKGDVAIAKLLLDTGADPNADMEDCDRAILHAAYKGNLEMVKLLVEHGADVNAWSEGDTAIMSAASNAHPDIFDYLYPLVDDEIRRHADKHGKKEMERAMKRRQRAANKLNEQLSDMAMYGKLAKVQELLTDGAEANVITECGKSPLMLAAMYGHIPVMEVLLEAGADPNLGSDEEFEEGQTALMYAVSSFWANNRADVVRFLVSRGADVNAQDEQGQTALMAAGENTDAVKALIDAGADVDLRDAEGNSAMMSGTFAVQQLLKQAGASQQGLDDVALVEAARLGDLAKVDDLLKAGANVNYGDGGALVAAAGQGNAVLVERLIQAGADVSLGWKSGLTAIAQAAYEGYLEIVELLLEAGADPYQRTHDEEFEDALGYAKIGQREGHHKGEGHAAIIKLLQR